MVESQPCVEAEARNPRPIKRRRAAPRWPGLLRRHPVPLALAAAVSLGCWVAAAPLQSWELALTGLAQEWRGSRRLRAPVTVVAIDDLSLQQAANADLSADPLLSQLRAWPWPRAVHAALLERMYRAGARAVAFDVLFDAPSANGEEDDRAFARALRRHPARTVLAAQVLQSKGEVAGLALSAPVPPLRAAVGEQSLGLLNGPSEADGSIRRRPGDHAAALRQDLAAVPPGLAQALLRAGGLPDRTG